MGEVAYMCQLRPRGQVPNSCESTAKDFRVQVKPERSRKDNPDTVQVTMNKCDDGDRMRSARAAVSDPDAPVVVERGFCWPER